eukprot:1684175-Prymnesium_polylepis.1
MLSPRVTERMAVVHSCRVSEGGARVDCALRTRHRVARRVYSCKSIHQNQPELALCDFPQQARNHTG